MTTAYLALGSNIGERATNLREACERLARHEALTVQARSRLYETQSVEGGGPDDFLNAALRASWTHSAMELLRWTQQVERDMGRPQPPRHGPRRIDVDLLLFGDEEINTPELQIPHPRMMRRAFVLRPLCDVLEGGWLREYPESF